MTQKIKKTIVVTGSTDGIGLEAAKRLAAAGHRVLVHGRSADKLSRAAEVVRGASPDGDVESYIADLSRLDQVRRFADELVERSVPVDVLINNAGVLRAPAATTPEGLDVRFVVNTIAPYLLARRLLAAAPPPERIVNLSSAAQSPVDVHAVAEAVPMPEMAAYAQSKLGLTMWSRHLALEIGDGGPVVVSVNPGSMLGTKMVREGFGVAGGDLGIGADILVRAALDDEFASASGQYFDNDARRFASPHPDALDPRKTAALVAAIDAALARHQA